MTSLNEKIGVFMGENCWKCWKEYREEIAIQIARQRLQNNQVAKFSQLFLFLRTRTIIDSEICRKMLKTISQSTF